MHVLIISSQTFSSSDTHMSGIFPRDQTHALARSGIKVGVISPETRSLLYLIKGRTIGLPKGVIVSIDKFPTYQYRGWRWIPGRIPWLGCRLFLLRGRKLFRQYVDEQGLPDIIHAHNSLYAGALSQKLKIQYKVPYVITEHSSEFLISSIKKWRKKLSQIALKNANYKIVVSRYLGNALERHIGSHVIPLDVVPNILPRLFERPIPQSIDENCNKGNFTFLSIGSLIEIKNHEGLLRAFASRFNEIDNIHLRIGGDGPLLNKLRELVRVLGLENQVTFLGLISREEVRNEMLGCDVFVLSSHHETFGVVLIEALSCGVPIISTVCGGPNDIINVKNGILVPINDNHILGNALETMIKLREQYDSTIIRRDCIKKYGEKNVIGKLTEIYSNVIENTEEISS